MNKKQLTQIIREQIRLKKGITEDLDPEADSRFKELWLDKLAVKYNQYKPVRLDDSNLKKDVNTLLAKNLPLAEFFEEFDKLYSIVTTRGDWKGGRNDIRDILRFLWKQDQSIRKGDTSNYGYRVHARRDKEASLNENYRERNDNLQFIINVLKAGKTSPIIEIFEKIVEHNDNDNLDQEIDQAVEEVVDKDESLKKYLDYESSKGSMYYGDMKEVKAGDKLKHKRTGAEMEVTKVSGDELTMKYTSVGTQPGAKVGGINKTSAKLVGKSYDLI